MNDKYQRAAMIMILSGVFISIIYDFSFKVSFIRKVNDKGYYNCAGIPTGGVAWNGNKISNDLCNKNKRFLMVFDMKNAKFRFFSSVIFGFIFSFGSVWGG